MANAKLRCDRLVKRKPCAEPVQFLVGTMKLPVCKKHKDSWLELMNRNKSTRHSIVLEDMKP